MNMKTLSPLWNLYGNLLIILGNFMFYFPDISELARNFFSTMIKMKIAENLYPGQKVREK